MKTKTNKTKRMNENTETPIQNIQDLLSEDLTNVDISKPLIAEGIITDFEVLDCEVATSKKDEQVTLLNITLSNKYEVPGVQSEKSVTIAPGRCKIYKILRLTPSEKMGPTRVREALKGFMVACGRASGQFGSPADYIGATCHCKVTIDVDDAGHYEPKNGVYFQAPKN